jgi:CHAT domain-containing protein/tetratricopeptide (TPR) repeat protein
MFHPASVIYTEYDWRKRVRVVLAFCLMCCAAAQNPRVLQQGHPLRANPGSVQKAAFEIEVSAGEYFRVLVRPNGAQINIRLNAPSGAILTELGNAAGEQRPLPISAIAQEKGAYRLEISLAHPDAPAREFECNLVELREAHPGDETRVAAEKAFDDGKRLQAEGSKESLNQAIARFEAALPEWRAIGDQAEEGHTFDTMGDAYWSLAQSAKANECYKKALPLAKAAGDQAGEASALSNLGVAASFREPKKALEFFEESLRLSREVQDRNLEATTLNNVGSVYILMGDPRKAREYALQARELKREVGDRQGEMTALSNLAAVYAAQGETHQALEALSETLPLRRKLHDQRGEANTLLNMATTEVQLGELDKALEAFRESLPLSRAVGDRRGEGRTLANLGALYMAFGTPQEALTALQEVLPISRELSDRHLEESVLTNIARSYLQLGEAQHALDYSTQALAIQKQISDQRGEGLALGTIGRVYAFMGESQKALELYQRALTMLNSANDRAGQADILYNIAELHLKSGDSKAALSVCERALALCRDIDDKRRLALAQVNIGSVYLALGEREKASDSLVHALAELTALGDRMQQSRALYYLARAGNSLGDLDHAREYLDQALEIDEQIRAAVIGPELRSSFFSTVMDQYELRVDLLMHLHQLHPKQGYDVQAFETSERARARGLLDLLSEAKSGLRQGVDPALLSRERVLTAQLHAKTERQIQLLAKQDPRAAAVEQEIRLLTTQYQEAEAKILAASPRYAAFAQTQPLTLAEFQRNYLDAGTLLLEYAPGDARSFVWAVTRTSFHAFELPKRSVLEELARAAYEGLTTTDEASAGTAGPALQELSHTLLGPVANVLGTKKLVIVASGALQYVPFAALPSPSAPAEPLVAAHEIVNLPSASTIAFIRRERRAGSRTSKVLAIFADPVFSADDPRVTGALAAAAKDTGAQRAASGFDQAKFPRLPFTRKEALDIMELVNPSQRLSALDFDASRATATKAALNQYRFVHIASHGLLNSLHPELSGLVLSTVDRAGKPQDGFLQTTDVYNLSLNADLVVLSACQTALGTEVRGEGLVGLARAFMYAGSPRVVASLWTVPDVSTSELMTRFYRGMLVEKLRPAAALRQAQLSIWKEHRWARPYYWAAFTLQGEWR